MSEEVKTCGRCGEAKPHSAFNRRSASPDGLGSYCRECMAIYNRERTWLDPEIGREREKKRKADPAERARRARRVKDWQKANPNAVRARQAVRYALKSGALKKLPCMFCEETTVHAHHRDYDKPLDVVWLCPKCHRRLHATFPETAGKNPA